MTRRAKPLDGKVAVVAGATRGAGRGIARGLAEAGALVYCTGRSVKGAPSPYKRPETIEETVEIVKAAGGAAVAVRVDHTVEKEVRSLFARIARRHGRVDIVVDSVAGEDPGFRQWTTIDKLRLDKALPVLDRALLSHIITAKHAAILMRKKSRGLIVEVTESDMLFGGGGNVLGDLVKSGLKNLALRLAWELRSSKIAVIAITPGFLRSEAMLDHFGVSEANWKDGIRKDKYFRQSESPLLVGRAIAALAADAFILEKTGDITSSWEVARQYRLNDADGTRPDWAKEWKEHVLPEMESVREWVEWSVERMERVAERAKDSLGKKRARATTPATQ